MNIKFINNKKLKSNSISLNIPLDMSEKVTDLNVIAEMLKTGCEKYPSLKEIYTKLQDMYGAVFDCFLNQCGEVVIFTVYIDFLKDRYIMGDEPLWEESIDFLHEIFYNTLSVEGSFKKDVFEIEKESIRLNIMSLVDSKDDYAYIKCEQLSTRNEPYSNYIQGDIKRLEEIDERSLYDYYKTLKTLPMYFVVIGDFEEEYVKNLLFNRFSENIQKKFLSNTNKFVKSEFVEEFERHNVKQTKLVMNFKTDVNLFNGDCYAFFIFNRILGGSYSKLYREVRYKKGLAYYVISHFEKFKGLLSIECGIDDKNFELTKETIFKEIENIQNGQIEDYEINNAKRAIKKKYVDLNDKMVRMHVYLTPLFIFGKDVSIDEMCANIDAVTKERVIEVSKTILKSAIFSVRPNS